MTSSARPGALDLRTLREQFDNSFAQPPAPPAAGRVNLLAVRIGGAPYALQLQDMRGLHAGLRILALPCRRAEFLGVTGIRGQLVPVWDLASLLGMEPAQSPRWLVLAHAPAALAFAFDQFDAHLCVTAEQMLAPDSHGAGGAVQTADGVLPLLPLRGLVERIAQGV